jgi:hypothetical protein
MKRRATLITVVLATVILSSTAVAGWVFFRAFARSMAVDDYVETLGIVTTSEYRRTGRSSNLVFVARYEVGGRSLLVNQTFGTPDGIDEDDIPTKLPPGSSVPVYYDASDPSTAVLTRDVPYVKWMILFVIALGCTIAVAIHVLRLRRS